ncbi:hypothetical protein B0T18DRAFT_400149 [Schizothecium vesticola]|uniref:Uncharacterized protein n=1 Tax=Schizothecium vesticola TaxID=314040 RepID=A0AA40FBP7_9PEZI|nr:hypothetical protein B0T18DRAFT_400149 [Schizothecium vesticola]
MKQSRDANLGTGQSSIYGHGAAIVIKTDGRAGGGQELEMPPPTLGTRVPTLGHQVPTLVHRVLTSTP